MVDLIGDIHGHADKLTALLKRMDYSVHNGCYSHPEGRTVILIGDYIDRGPEIRQTLEIVKAMVDSGNAIALMGNHEYNAICFHTEDRRGGYLREHTDKNTEQHTKTLEQFKGNEAEMDFYIRWFKSLPLFYETDAFRAVHACWNHSNIDFLRQNIGGAGLSDEFVFESSNKGRKSYDVIEATLKGVEIAMPDGLTFKDKYGHTRKEMRIKWWRDPAQSRYKDLSIIQSLDLPDRQVEITGDILTEFYDDPKPVFFGHYWLEGEPKLYPENSHVCCLDFSVANGGYLAAYRYYGERRLDESNFIYV